MTDEYEVETSPLSQVITAEGQSVQVDIYRGEHGGWILEVVDMDNNSTLWDDEFETDALALAEAKEAISQEGISSFIGSFDQ